MGGLLALARLAVPIVAAVGAVAAWLGMKRGPGADEPETWRDASLDDWREERRAAWERERAEREETRSAPAHPAGDEGNEGETTERMGG